MHANVSSPRKTLSFVGHKDAEASLIRAWNTGAMPHAWLFTGIKGIGKATLAYRFSRFVLTPKFYNQTDYLFRLESFRTNPANLDTPLKMAHVELVNNDSHPNLMVVERTKNQRTLQLRQEIVLDDIKPIAQFLQLTPGLGEWRIVIIDSVDDLNRHSGNALLKFLEEPPSRTIFLLISHRPGKLLPTIRSRCRQLHLYPLEDGLIRNVLASIDDSLTSSSLETVLRLGEGSIGRGIEILNQNGVSVLNDVVRLFETFPELNFYQINEFNETWSKVKKSDIHNVLVLRLQLVLFWLGQGMRNLAANRLLKSEVVQGEQRIFESLVTRFGLGEVCARLSTAERMLVKYEQVNLDPKNLINSVILSLLK